jgi:hypothetical protein
MRTFNLGESVDHRAGDHRCPQCADDYPEPCRCGGLMHAVPTGEADADGTPVLVSQCDTCGRSAEE